jgi:hypothetical protein
MLVVRNQIHSIFTPNGCWQLPKRTVGTHNTAWSEEPEIFTKMKKALIATRINFKPFSGRQVGQVFNWYLALSNSHTL